MLKIRDDVDLKELEKFGFKADKYDLFYEYHSKSNCKDIIMINMRNKKFGFYPSYNGKSYDVLYDLIQAGLVEKVEDKWLKKR